MYSTTRIVADILHLIADAIAAVARRAFYRIKPKGQEPMTPSDALDRELADACLGALRTALATAQTRTAGRPIAAEIGRLTQARLVVTGDGNRVLVELLTPTESGETTIYSLELLQETFQ